MQTQFGFTETLAFGMSGIVEAYLGVALEANRDRVLDGVVMRVRPLLNMGQLYLYAAELVADAAASVTLSQQLRRFFLGERHGQSSPTVMLADHATSINASPRPPIAGTPAPLRAFSLHAAIFSRC